MPTASAAYRAGPPRASSASPPQRPPLVPPEPHPRPGTPTSSIAANASTGSVQPLASSAAYSRATNSANPSPTSVHGARGRSTSPRAASTNPPPPVPQYAAPTHASTSSAGSRRLSALPSTRRTSYGNSSRDASRSPPSTARRRTTGTQTEAVLAKTASHALSSALNELLAVTLQDDLATAAEWATHHARDRAFALVDDDGAVEDSLDELIRAILRLKQRVKLHGGSTRGLDAPAAGNAASATGASSYTSRRSASGVRAAQQLLRGGAEDANMTDASYDGTALPRRYGSSSAAAAAIPVRRANDASDDMLDVESAGLGATGRSWPPREEQQGPAAARSHQTIDLDAADG